MMLTPALIRGVAARFIQPGCKVGGFDAYCESTVLPGSGLSSSAAYEVLISFCDLSSRAASYMYLQNVIPAGNTTHQEVAVALGL